MGDTLRVVVLGCNSLMACELRVERVGSTIAKLAVAGSLPRAFPTQARTFGAEPKPMRSPGSQSHRADGWIVPKSSSRIVHRRMRGDLSSEFGDFALQEGFHTTNGSPQGK